MAGRRIQLSASTPWRYTTQHMVAALPLLEGVALNYPDDPVVLDGGIVRDYPLYRTTNHDKLKRYWLEVVIAADDGSGSGPKWH